MHSGTIAHAEEKLDDAIHTIYDDEFALWAGTGDYGEYITPDDDRWEVGLISSWVDPEDIAQSQEDYIVKKFTKIKDKCLGLHWGNHEYYYTKHKYGKVHEHICKRLEVDNLGFSCFLHLVFKRKSSTEAHLIRCCGTHGSSNAITSSGKQNILTRWMNNNDADIYWYAHMHDILHRSRNYLGVNSRLKIKNMEALGVVTGGFYKSYVSGTSATYAERRNYPPNKLGYPIIEIDIEEMSLMFSEKVYLKV